MASNGQLPASDLAYISGTNARVLASLVTQTNALRAAFAKRFNKPLSITDAYRIYSTQESMFRRRYTTNYNISAKIDRRWWSGTSWWRRVGMGSSATPGTSNHGWGRAIDFGARVNILGSEEQEWMVTNAPRFGYVWPKTFRKAPYLEPWHYEGSPVSLASYQTYLVQNDISVPGLSLPESIVPKEDDMFEATDRATLDAIKTKMERQDPQLIHFQLADGRNAVAVPRAFVWAIAPDDATWKKHRDVLLLLGLLGTWAVKTWAQITGNQNVVHTPAAFGRQVAWDALPADLNPS